MSKSLQAEELSTLAKSLASEYDRQKYIKVIEMSNIIRSKLAVLQEEKQRSSIDTLKSRKTLVNDNASEWNFNDFVYDHNNRSSSQSISSDNTTIATTSSHYGDDVTKSSYLDETAFLSGMSLPGRLSRNHTFQVIDHATSLKSRSEFTKRPTTTDVLYHKASVKPTKVALKATLNDDIANKQRLSCDSSSSSEVEFPTTIHVAVRKDASLYTIQKKETSRKLADTGLLTPPESPQFRRNSCSSSMERTFITPVYKKTQNLKGLLRRSCQLNQYTITKTNSAIPLSPLLFVKAINSTDGRQKWLLKLTIVRLGANTPEPQRKFGFTFWSDRTSYHRVVQEEAKFALAPDSLVREALLAWIDEQTKQGLPPMSKADDVLRDGRKLYIIYDADLLK